MPLLFHSWKSCPGVIATERVGDDALMLRCMECGAIVGRMEPGLMDEFVALIPDVVGAAVADA